MRRVIRGQWSVVSGLLLVAVCLGLMGQVGVVDEGRGAVRFVPVDVVVDCGGVGLGAYQVEVKALEGVKVVGVEGGEAAVFREAPFYDPAVLVEGERIVVAAFSTEAGLPVGKVRVARLHLVVAGAVADGAIEKMTSKLVVATDGDGKSIAAKVSLRVEQGDR